MVSHPEVERATELDTKKWTPSDIINLVYLLQDNSLPTQILDLSSKELLANNKKNPK